MRRRPFSILVLLAATWFDSSSQGAELGPPIRTGLWTMQKLPEGKAAVSEMVEELRPNHNLDGVCLHVDWKTLQSKKGAVDFAPLDLAVAGLRSLGMKYQICLKPGANTPDYVYSEGAAPFSTQITNPHRANAGETVRIPVPWDPVYEREFAFIIQKLGEHYSDDPLCVSVVLTCANYLSAEMHLPKTRSDLRRWQELGDYESKLLGVYQKFIDEWGKAFPKQDLSLHVSKVLDLPPSFCQHIVDYGLGKYPQRFSIQNCQLTGRREDMGMMSYDLIQRNRARAHHGFQSLAGLSRPNERMGSMEMAALNVVHGTGDYWELWHGDGFSLETSAAVSHTWHEAREMGYEAYKKKLISEGKYR